MPRNRLHPHCSRSDGLQIRQQGVGILKRRCRGGIAGEQVAFAMAHIQAGQHFAQRLAGLGCDGLLTLDILYPDGRLHFE